MNYEWYQWNLTAIVYLFDAFIQFMPWHEKSQGVESEISFKGNTYLIQWTRSGFTTVMVVAAAAAKASSRWRTTLVAEQRSSPAHRNAHFWHKPGWFRRRRQTWAQDLLSIHFDYLVTTKIQRTRVRLACQSAARREEWEPRHDAGTIGRGVAVAVNRRACK